MTYDSGHHFPHAAWIFVTTATFLFFYNMLRATGNLSALLWALAIIQLSPLILDLILGRTSLLSCMLIIHFFYTCFAKIYLLMRPVSLLENAPAIRHGLEEQIISTAIILASYLALSLLFPSRRENQKNKLVQLEVSLNACFFLIVYFLMIPWRGYWCPSSLTAINNYLCSLVIIAVLTVTPKGYDRIYRILVPLLGIYLWVDYLLSVMMTYIALFLFAYILLALINKKLSIIPYCIVGLGLFSFMQIIKGPLRNSLWHEENSERSFSDRIELVMAAAEESLFESGGPSDEMSELPDADLAEETLSRINEDILGRVIELSPDVVPFLSGRSYEQLLYLAIPRFLWAGKPSVFSANEFGRLYQFISEFDFGTSISMPILAEGYANFGYSGLYSVAALLGCIVFLAQRVCQLPLEGNYQFSFLALFTVFIRYENPLSTVIYTFTGVMIALYALKFWGTMAGFLSHPIETGGKFTLGTRARSPSVS